MPANKLVIRRQIKSIGTTKKMTKAMELVSASKMRKSHSAVLAARPYAHECWELIRHLAPRTEKKLHPLLVRRPLKKLGVVVVSTNRGLCGAFNNALAQKVLALIAEHKKQGLESVEIISCGKRARDILSRSGYPPTADFSKKDITTDGADLIPIASLIAKKYQTCQLDAVYLATTHFVSSVRQQPKVTELLPFHFSVDESAAAMPSPEAGCEYLFEPSSFQVLDYIIPRILETQLYQAVLESEASEHSARMLAMHNASEAATDMLFDLQLTYNSARQAAITQEIAEISSGRAALE